MNDSIINGQYHDFKFVTELPSAYGGPVEREVTFVSAGWNFMILFSVLIMIVIGKHFNMQQMFYMMRSPFQKSAVDKNVRDVMSSSLLSHMSVVISSVLLISLFLHKTMMIYGANKILYDNFSFYIDIVCGVSAFFVISYLLMAFYVWIFDNGIVLHFYVNLNISNLEMVNMILIPILMILFFYPYKFFCIVAMLLIVMIYLMRFINFFVEIRLLPKVSFVNIFLYLCTLEVMTLMIMFKLVYDVFITL